jgi:O-antigen/teichoic acid export membrane protein
MRRPVEALLTVLVGLLGALQLSLTGVVRAAGDLRPEAVLKLAVGVLSPPAAAVALLAGGTAVAALTGLAIANALALAAVRRPLARTVGRGDRVSPGAALRRAIPLGAIALATLAYYRSGTLALALLGRPAQTAVFATASTVAFGLLMAGNAVTAALLPRLAAARDAADLAAVTRPALACATGIGVVLAAGAAGLADPIVTVAFGSRYAGAAAPLSLLALATAFIAPAGVLGTALIAAGRLRPVALQVGLSLVVNVSALALLVPAFGAVGAAAATVACETVALLTLALAAVRALPGLLPALSRPRLAPPSIARGAR